MTMKDSPLRSVITRLPQGLSIGIPSKKNWYVIIFLSFWLCGWLMGELFAITSLFNEFGEGFFSLFILFWLAIWTLGGAMAIYSLLWQVFGREVIHVEGKVLSYQRMIFGFGRTRAFDIREIKEMALAKEKAKDSKEKTGKNNLETPWGMKSGKISFSYAGKKYRFASDVDKAEAEQLLQLLKDSPNFSEENFA